MGYVHFEELFGERRSELHQDGVSIVAVDSTEPDLDHGVIWPRALHPGSRSACSHEAFLRIFVLHHHLLPIPGTGRERNVVHDAGDTLECLQRADAHLLSGHKHVPYAWRLENLFVVNAGTVSTTRLRGKTKPCYNVIEASPERVTVYRKYLPRPRRDSLVRPAHTSTRRTSRCSVRPRMSSAPREIASRSLRWIEIAPSGDWRRAFATEQLARAGISRRVRGPRSRDRGDGGRRRRTASPYPSRSRALNTQRPQAARLR